MGGKRENNCDGKSVVTKLGRRAEREDGRSGKKEGDPCDVNNSFKGCQCHVTL